MPALSQPLRVILVCGIGGFSFLVDRITHVGTCSRCSARAGHARSCVSRNRKPVDIKLLQSELVGWLLEREVMMIRCNWMQPTTCTMFARNSRSLKVPLNRKEARNRKNSLAIVESICWTSRNQIHLAIAKNMPRYDLINSICLNCFHVCGSWSLLSFDIVITQSTD